MMRSGSQIILWGICLSVMGIGIPEARYNQMQKRNLCLVSKTDSRDSAVLAEEYFYYKSGVDSLMINHEDGLSRKSYNFFDTSGRITKNERRFPDGTLDAIVTFQWLSRDSLVFRRQVSGSSIDLKLNVKLINPKIIPYLGIGGDSIKYSGASRNDTLIDYSAITVAEYDSSNGRAKQVHHVWDRGTYTADTTLFFNTYDHGLLTQFIEKNGIYTKYYFCGYKESGIFVRPTKKAGGNRKSGMSMNYNSKGQRVPFFNGWQALFR